MTYAVHVGMTPDGKRLAPSTPFELKGDHKDPMREKFNRGIALEHRRLFCYPIKVNDATYLVNKCSLCEFLNLSKYFSTDQTRKTPEERGICFQAKLLDLMAAIETPAEETPKSSQTFFSKWFTTKTLMAVASIGLAALAIYTAYAYGAFENPLTTPPPTLSPEANINT